MISESSRGLFQRGIIMAGSALNNAYSVIPRRNWSRQLAAILGLESTSETEILSFLEVAEPQDIVRAQMQLMSPESMIEEGFSIPFGPTIEPFQTLGVFLFNDIPTLVRNAWGNEISIIIGATSKEGLEILPLIRTMPEMIETFSNFENYIPRELNIERNTDQSRRYAETLRAAYYGRMQPSVTNVDGLLTVQPDLNVWHPVHRTIQYRLQANSAPTYVYRFDADSQNNVATALLPQDMIRFYRQPSHGDDVFHLFRSNMHRPLSQMNEVSRNTLELMVGLFTNFAASGNPVMPNRALPHWPIAWPYVGLLPNENDNLFGLNIKENSTTVGSLPEASRAVLFEQLTVMHRNGATPTYAAGLVKIAFLILVKYLIL